MKASPRIVSLIPAGTEIVCALGFEEALVGRSHECDFPASVQHLPICSRPRIDVQASSAEIDRRVRETLRAGLSVYEVDTALLRDLAPDVVVTQAQCEACAVSLGDLEDALASWTGLRPTVVSLEPRRLEDVWEDMQRVADALDAAPRGRELTARLRARIEALAARARELPSPPRVGCIEWVDPLMAAGNWVPTLVGMAGGEDVFGRAGAHAPALEWPELVHADPDVLVGMPCGYDLERTRREFRALSEHDHWPELTAVRHGRVALTDGHQYFNRPGPRLVESLEILAEILHPRTFAFGHSGRGWQWA